MTNLYETDYNLILKYFWSHKATHLAEQSKILGENTWEDRPNCSTNYATLLDELITEIHQLIFTPLCNSQNNTKLCYDRIIPAHAMQCSRKFEIPSSIYALAANT